MLHSHSTRQKGVSPPASDRGPSEVDIPQFQRGPRQSIVGLEDVKLLSSNLQQMSYHGATTNTFDESNNKYIIPNHGLPEQTAYDLIHNELTLDGNPHLNLASFVNTTTTQIANRLIMENIDKNLADNDEYPQLIELTQRCISMLAKLWKSNPDMEPIGCATTGSSEAIMLGGLAMKKIWEAKMKKAGKSVEKPNILMSSACQVALEKFARYFEVECRLIPVCKESKYCLDPRKLWDYVDENTIGCYVLLGTTYTGHLENVEEVADVLTEIEIQHPSWSNKEIPIHVDGASGGFIVPFSFEASHMKKFGLERWGFNNPRVVSINTSGHKFGLTTPGLGWALWKDQSYLPPELRFRLKYLGGVEETFNLNFSRPGFQVVHQYYNFVSLGFTGYKNHFLKSLFVARTFAYSLLKSEKLQDYIEVISGIHERISDDKVPDNVTDYWENPQDFKPGVPLIAFKLSKHFNEAYPEIPQAIISKLLRTRGWIVPNYPLPNSSDDSSNWEVLRVVFRTEMKLDFAQLLIIDIENIITKLLSCYEKVEEHAEQEKQTKEGKRQFIYDMLLTLASPESEEDEKLKERVTRNYRGTC
ncbi:glutamate decarboxylase GAD1 NDAI_0K00690 [Naumovozyma dairenensis CBS 421]|uniref:Glutamate decarboxylase n=1 Tax=Naumovozyma dairenensis (strain ATCC 10597 / BCRC 20456 / CBS 421 / NBRC 0211 / NRRL Y-12639) TaxID=1071378 RepID=G0WHJ9_NAUDC|nr:hypothetical protein NDAI_0K00690 [Naumovozyma dairenensis CBS 421]CCD27260.1 hypothetical protein NDAI_0K00690 [Naumovozyma dairenensis CBS 421]